MNLETMSRPIRMAVMEPQRALKPVPNHYELNPHGRMAWLHLLLWRALHKMRALKLGMEETVSYKTVTIDADKVGEQIVRAEYALYGKPGCHPKRILIGPAEMAELMREAAWNDFAMHSAPTSIRTYRGMEIEVVPHMQGVLVL